MFIYVYRAVWKKGVKNMLEQILSTRLTKTTPPYIHRHEINFLPLYLPPYLCDDTRLETLEKLTQFKLRTQNNFSWTTVDRYKKGWKRKRHWREFLFYMTKHVKILCIFPCIVRWRTFYKAQYHTNVLHYCTGGKVIGHK